MFWNMGARLRMGGGGGGRGGRQGKVFVRINTCKNIINIIFNFYQLCFQESKFFVVVDLVVFILLRKPGTPVLRSQVQFLVMVGLFLFLFYLVFSPLSFFQWKFSGFGSQFFKSLFSQNIKS